MREDYTAPVTLGRLVLADLTALIDSLYPEGSELDPLEHDAAEHDAAHVINEIFKSANCKTVQKIDLRVQAHVGFGDDLKKWTDVLIVDALRSSHKKDVLLNTVEECSRYLKWFNVRTNF